MAFEATSSGIIIKNAAGETTFDTTRSALYIADYKSGTTVLPRATTSASAANIDLGAVDARTQIIGGSFRITNAEGLSLGERRLIGSHTSGRFQIYLYGPRIRADHVFSIGGPTVIEGFSWPFGATSMTAATTGGQPMNVGRSIHILQFVLSGGRLRLVRGGMQIAYQQTTFGVVQGPVIAQYGFTMYCAALTIQYRVWCGAFN